MIFGCFYDSLSWQIVTSKTYKVGARHAPFVGYIGDASANERGKLDQKFAPNFEDNFFWQRYEPSVGACGTAPDMITLGLDNSTTPKKSSTRAS